MRDLLACRDDIARIDTQIIKLLEERMDVANDIAEYKLVLKQSIVDASREHAKLVKLRAQAKHLGLPPSYVSDVFKTIIKNTCAQEQHYIVAKANQSSVVRDTSVAYLGNTGSYSHVASSKYLEGFKGNIRFEGCQTFAQIVGLVESGKCEYGILPVKTLLQDLSMRF